MRHRILLLIVCTLSLMACKTVPGTGRKQLNFMSIGQEMTLGAQAYTETLSQSNLITSGRDYEMVRRIGDRIAQAAVAMYPEPAAEFEWDIQLIDEPQTANAWCLPGGKMAVYTGLLPITQDEDSLAAVVGHEVAHAVARHGGERMSQQMGMELVLGIVDVGLGNSDPARRDAVMQTLTGVSTVGVMLPFSRSHESEADEIGLMMAANAGYDPRAAVGLWERMAARGGERPPEFLSTHPSESTRIAHLQEIMPRALKLYEKSKQR